MHVTETQEESIQLSIHSSLSKNRLGKFAGEDADTETTGIQIQLEILNLKQRIGKNEAKKKIQQNSK